MMRTCRAIWIALLLGPWLASADGRADEPLRWKFAVGDEFTTRVELIMRLKLDHSSGSLATEAREELELIWQVRNVTLTGDAVLVGKCNRVRARLQDKNGEELQFDSSAGEPASGLAAMLAPTYEAMMDGEYRLTVSPRGQVSQVQISPEVEQAIRTAPGVESSGADAAVDAFRATLTEWIVPLPDEPPPEGKTWSTRSPAAIPGLAGGEVVTEYEYAGTRELDHRTYAVIRVALQLKLADGAEPTAIVKDEQSGGEAMFDAAAGRLRWMRVEHRATLELALEGQAHIGTIDQVIDIVVTPRK